MRVSYEYKEIQLSTCILCDMHFITNSDFDIHGSYHLLCGSKMEFTECELPFVMQFKHKHNPVVYKDIDRLCNSTYILEN